MPVADAPVHANLLARIVPFAGLRVREDTLYTDASGIEKDAIRRRAEKDLRQAAEILTRLLKPNEVVLYVAHGALLPGTFDQIVSMIVHFRFFLPATGFSGVLLVFTNCRLIALRIKRKLTGAWNWDQGISTVEWAEVAQADQKGWVLPYVVLVNQREIKEKFWQLRRCDAAKIKLLLTVFGPSGPLAIPPTAGAFYSLCPRCLAALESGVYQCSGCGTVFKDEKSLVIRALLIPGGAYFYVGNYIPGIVSGLIETSGLIIVAMDCVGVARGWTPMYVAVYDLGIWPVLVLLKAVGIYRVRSLIRKFILA